MKLKHIIKEFENVIPLSLQEKWDHCGLNLGSREQDIQKILFSYDVCKESVDEAISKGCNLIVSHHPFRMSADVSLNLDSYEGQLIQRCIKNDIALYSAHTNHDSSVYSLNHFYLNKLGIENTKPLVLNTPKFFKMIVYVPKEHTQNVMDALFAAGAGHVGSNYSECSFRTEGTGTFKGNENANPAIGEKLKRESVQEDRLETLVHEADLNKVIQNMLKAHPYEEVAYDVIALHEVISSKCSDNILAGLGAKGSLKKPISKEDLVEKIKEIFKVENIRLIDSGKTHFQHFSICTGSGSSLINKAIRAKSDVFITGDVKYHQAIEAKRRDLTIIDVGHFHSEIASVNILKGIFQQIFNSKLEYHEFQKLRDAFDFL